MEGVDQIKQLTALRAVADDIIKKSVPPGGKRGDRLNRPEYPLLSAKPADGKQLQPVRRELRRRLVRQTADLWIVVAVRNDEGLFRKLRAASQEGVLAAPGAGGDPVEAPIEPAVIG